MMPLLDAALVPGPDQVVVRFTGDADLSTAPFMTDVLAQAGGLGTHQVVVDLVDTRFWDCSGLHALVGFTRALTLTGRACRIAGAQPATRRLIRMANLACDLQLDGVPAAPAPRGVSIRRAPVREPAPVTGDLVAAGAAG